MAAEVEGEDGDALTFVLDWVRGGETLAKLTDKINKRQHDCVVGRTAIVTWLRQEYGAENVDALLLKARADSAHALVDEARQIVDDCPLSKEDLMHARMRSDLRLWQAERYDKQAYGKQGDGAQVVVNILDLHLTALQARASRSVEMTHSVPALPAGAKE